MRGSTHLESWPGKSPENAKAARVQSYSVDVPHGEAGAGRATGACFLPGGRTCRPDVKIRRFVSIARRPLRGSQGLGAGRPGGKAKAYVPKHFIYRSLSSPDVAPARRSRFDFLLIAGSVPSCCTVQHLQIPRDGPPSAAHNPCTTTSALRVSLALSLRIGVQIERWDFVPANRAGFAVVFHE